MEMMWQMFLAFPLFVLILPSSHAMVALDPTPSLPVISCPVGETVDSALFFGISQDQLSDRALELAGLTEEEEKKTKLVDELKPLVADSQVSASMVLSDLLDLASLYYALKMKGDSSIDLETKEQLRLRLESEVLSEQELEEKQFLRWTIGKLTDQELVMIGCNVPFLAPNGISCSDLEENITYQDGTSPVTDVTSAEDCRDLCADSCVVWTWTSSTSSCITMSTMGTRVVSPGSVSGKQECGGSQVADVDRCYTTDNTVALATPKGLDTQDCKLRCRADKYLYQVLGGDQECMCASQALTSISHTNDCSLKLITTGLGWHSNFRYKEVEPTSALSYPYLDTDPPQTDFVDAKTFQDRAGRLMVILYETHCAIFKVTADPQAEEEDSAVETTSAYVDHRRWDGKNDVDKYNKEHKNLLKHENLENLLSEGSDQQSWVEVKKSSATSFTILPIFVKMDEQFFPDTPIVYDDDEYPIYDDDTWISNRNLAGRPIPGGKWYKHILISHKSRKKMRFTSEPTMTLLRILEDGTLLHILDRYSNQGQFEVDDFLLKEPTDILAMTMGRSSYTMVASNSPLPDIFPPADYSVVKGFKIVEDTSVYSVHALTNFFTTVPMEFKIPAFNVVKIGIVDFLWITYLAVLDRSSLNGDTSRLRLFQYDFDASGEYTVKTEANSTMEFSGVFTKMHSFVREEDRYLVLTKTASSASDIENVVNLYQVEITGKLVFIQKFVDQDGVLVDMKPAETGVAGNEAELLEVRKISDASVVKLQCSIVGFNYDAAEWEYDPLRLAQTIQFNENLNADSALLYEDDLYKAIDVFHLDSRVFGMLFRIPRTSSSDLFVDMVRFSSVMMPMVDDRLLRESNLVARINMLDRRIVTNTDSLMNSYDQVQTNIDSYVQDSKSVVTGNWNIKTLKVGRLLKLAGLSPSTPVTVNVRNSEGINTHTTEDFSKILDVDLSQATSKLDTISSNLASLKTKHDDLLLLDTGDHDVTQTVTSKVVLEDLTATKTFKLTSSSDPNLATQLKVATLAKDLDSLDMTDLYNIFSSGKNQQISGQTTLTGTVRVTDGLTSVKLSAEKSGITTTVTTANLLRYDQDQSFLLPQVFTGPVSVSANFGFDVGVKGKDAAETVTEIDFSEDISSLSAVLGDIRFVGAVTAEVSGLTAPNLESSFLEDVDENLIVRASEETVYIQGKLIIKAISDDFSASGNSIGIAGANMNTHNIQTLYDTAAWTYAPSSLPAITPDSVITFTKNVHFSSPITVNSNIVVTKINDFTEADYIKKSHWEGSEECLVEGTKTLKSASSFDEVVAQSYNGLSLDQFVTKTTEQIEFPSLNTFSASVTLQNIVKSGTTTPTIDGRNLDSLLSSDIPSVISAADHILSNLVSNNMQFTKLKIGGDATLKIMGTMNGIDLTDRFPNIVLSTDSSVAITGDKVFKSAVAADAITMNTMKTSEDVPKTYKLSDFVNRLNSQTISGKKNFQSQVTFSNMFIVGEETKINNVKVAPLLQCWINRMSDADSIEIDNKISFQHLKTPGLKITRQGTPPRDCDGMTDSLYSAASWILDAQTVAGLKDDTEGLRSNLVEYLANKSPSDETLETTADTGDGGLAARTFFTVILSEPPLDMTATDLLTMNTASKRDMVHLHLYKKFGMKLSSLAALNDVTVASLTCRYPELNTKDVKTDLALLDQDNVFCLLGATDPARKCGQTFAGGFEANRLQVGGNLLTLANMKVLGVDLSEMETCRVSLTKAQTLDGTYTFNDMSLKASTGHFTGDISFLYGGSSLSLANFIAKFLKKTSTAPQTFTTAREISKLTASSSIVTGDGVVTKPITYATSDYNIKNIYDAHDHLDAVFTFSGNFEFNGEVSVGMNVAVSGLVEGVDIEALAKDLVVSGTTISVYSDPPFYITGVDSGTVAFTGKKTFSIAPTVSTNIEVNSDDSDALIPVVDTSTMKDISFMSTAGSDGPFNRILTIDTEQTITGQTYTIDGDVLIQGNLGTDSVDSVAVADINAKYSYDSSNSVHQLSSAFSFTGDLAIDNLEAKLVDGRDWNMFVADAMPGVATEDSTTMVTVTGNKQFSGEVTLEKADTTINLFNTKNLETEYAAAAFLEETIFTGSNTFTGDGKVTFEAGKFLTAKESLALTDSTIPDVGNLEWLYDNTIKIDDNLVNLITGKIKFIQDLSLKGDSTVGSLGKLYVPGNEFDYSLNVPDDLVMLDTTALASTNGKDRQFAGVTLNKNTKVDGKLADYDLTKYSTVLYKTGDQTISAEKTFSKAKMTKAVSSTGLVNGLSLTDNLVYLSASTIMQGNYKFEGDVSIKNLDVSGTIDETEFDVIDDKLLSKDTAQTVTSTYSFNCPALTFTGEIVGDGDDANGEGRINEQDVSSLKAVGNTWKRIAAVKVSAQAEAMVLCSHVSDLSAAYLDNIEVSFYTAMGSLTVVGAAFSDIQMIQFGDVKVGIALSGSTVHLFYYGQLEGDPPAMIDMEESLDIKSGGSSVTGARSLLVVHDPIVYDTNSYSLIALVVCEQGMAVLKVSVVVGVSEIVGTITQAGEVVPGVVAVSLSNELKQILLVSMSAGPPYSYTVSSVPISKLSQCARSGLCCNDGVCANWAFKNHWTSAEFIMLDMAPKLDTITMASSSTAGKLVVALCDRFDSIANKFVRSLILDYTKDAKGKYTLTTSNSVKVLVAVDQQDFVLVASGDKVFLVSGGKMLTTYQLWAGSKDWKVVSEVETRGELVNLRREDKDTVSMLEGAENVVFFKYSGVDGMQLDRRVFSTNAPLSSFSSLLSPASIGDNLLVTASTTDTLAWYVSAPSFDATPLQLKCREPEVGFTSLETNEYCNVSPVDTHTLCELDKPKETCDIANRELTEEFKTKLHDLHNDFRRKVAKGETSVPLPTASNMRKLAWSDELQNIAQMWADQCTPGHDNNRNMLGGGRVGQNVLAFKGLVTWDVTESTMNEVVKYWFSEENQVNAEDISPFKFRDEAGHFTQLAWANTDQIGCGWTQYVDESEEHPYISLVVCNYYTTGNVEGVPMWTIGTACENCPEGFSCDDGLCVDDMHAPAPAPQSGSEPAPVLM